MEKGLTVNDLYGFCAEQIARGNGNKHIQITCDDECNGYHTLFYQFNADREEIEACLYADMFHDKVNADEIILLG